ncbi:MAG: DUF937 domain-containing protein [Beijerinckiaceae bacterium]
MPMKTLLEMVQNAQGGQAMDNLARQFALSQEQAGAAVNAVLPAFQLGLQRQAENADMMANFLRTLAGGAHGVAFEHAPEPAEKVEEKGKDVLGMLFGNTDVAQAVADQAARFSGVPNTVMSSMMPMIASMIMGGLMNGMNSQGYGNWLGQMANGMPGFGGMGAKTLQDTMAQMVGMQPKPQPGMFGAMGAMMDSMMGTKAPEPANPLQAGMSVLSGMFDAGAKVQKAHFDSMNAIFTSMLKAGGDKG